MVYLICDELTIGSYRKLIASLHFFDASYKALLNLRRYWKSINAMFNGHIACSLDTVQLMIVYIVDSARSLLRIH